MKTLCLSGILLSLVAATVLASDNLPSKADLSKRVPPIAGFGAVRDGYPGESLPGASIRVFPSNTGNPPFNVTLAPSGSFALPGKIINYDWDFGDGSPSHATLVASPVSHAFTSPGEHKVTLRVIDSEGRASVASTVVRVVAGDLSKMLPVPDFSYSRVTGAGSLFAFDASASRHPGGGIVRYDWSFGDGGVAKGKIVAHDFESEGQYPVRLTVTDNNQVTATREKTIAVEPQALVGLDRGLVGYWSFDNCTPSDSSGRGNHGTIIGGASCVPGAVGDALSFNGVDGYVEVPDNPSQQIASNRITISAWINLDADVGVTQQRIVNKQQTGGTSWGMEIAGNGYGGATGNNLLVHDSSGSTWRNCMSNTNLQPGRWYHVAATDNAGDIRLYIDGNLDKTCSGGYGIPANIASPIVIGKSAESDHFHFCGRIDEVRVYDRVLGQAEVSRLASRVCLRQRPPVLAGHRDITDSNSGSRGRAF